uniref:Retrovirus-related Pol polyprotein from transposon TNT 1-94-like beta-barrel domain-containing protein n=1 Tax=Brassica oleracea var. oleracea TaxID=109376 RepID=A0A0D3AGT1_BRAOL
MVTEVNVVEGSNSKEWWYDTGATTHICTDRAMFSTNQKSKNQEKLFMGNTAVSKIE